VKLDLTVHTALDELRMQMLGTQVLFGFQFQGVFHEEFPSLPPVIQIIDLSVFGFLVLTLGLLIAPAAQHRLVERGTATKRLFDVVKVFAALALATYVIAIGLDVFVVTSSYWGFERAAVGGFGAVFVAMVLWFGLGFVWRGRDRSEAMPDRKEPERHEKIDQMLTESRVILPGAQALLGFQFVVTMTKAFKELSPTLQMIHFCGLGAVLLAIMLLIAPAAIHRLGFRGLDAERMHEIGSLLITIALIPLAAGIAIDVNVALSKVLHDDAVSLAGGIGSFILLSALWYGLPIAIRAREGRSG
jgi:hypothetical protein